MPHRQAELVLQDGANKEEGNTVICQCWQRSANLLNIPQSHFAFDQQYNHSCKNGYHNIKVAVMNIIVRIVMKKLTMRMW